MEYRDKTEEELLSELRALTAELGRRQGLAGLEAAEIGAVELGDRLRGEALSAWAASVSDPEPEPGKPAPKAACPHCGRSVGVRRYRVARELSTLGGDVTIYRHYHYCRKCGEGFYPKDAELCLGEGEASPGVEKFCLDFAVREPFAEVSELMALHHCITLSATQVQWILARCGDRWQAAGEASPPPKQSERPLIAALDGSMQPGRAGWKEGKLACLETLGFPSERHYIGTTSGLTEFEQRLTRGLKQARAFEREVIWIGDGAEWIWKMQERLAPDAFCLLDWYHLKVHISVCADALLGEGTPESAIFRERACDLLWDNRVDDCLAELEECHFLCGRGSAGAERRKAIADLQTYIANHGRFMDYPTARARGWPLGSGPVESAHRSVWHVRLKRPGARWSTDGLERMAQLRVLYANTGAMRFYEHLRKAA